MAEISTTALTQLSEHYHAYLSWTPAKVDGEKVILSYSGEINQLRIDTLLKLAEHAVLDNGSKRKVMKRVCSVLIECLQNIAIHGTKDNEGSSKSFVILLADQVNFTLVSGNLILQQDANLLAYKIDELSKLSPTELRKLYIETLCNQNYSYKGGAGLGFLTIAKKSDVPMQYKILSIDDRFAFFTTEIRVSR